MKVGPRRLDRRPARPRPPQVGFLHHVVGVALRAQHPIGETSEHGPVFLEDRVSLRHDDAPASTRRELAPEQRARAGPLIGHWRPTASASSPSGPTQSPARKTFGCSRREDSRPAGQAIFAGKRQAVRNRHTGQITPRRSCASTPTWLNAVETTFQLLLDRVGRSSAFLSQILHHMDHGNASGASFAAAECTEK